MAPYLGSLLSLNYPETVGVSPDFWKSSLYRAAQAILEAQTKKAPTVICLEDLTGPIPPFWNFCISPICNNGPAPLPCALIVPL